MDFSFFCYRQKMKPSKNVDYSEIYNFIAKKMKPSKMKPSKNVDHYEIYNFDSIL